MPREFEDRLWPTAALHYGHAAERCLTTAYERIADVI